MTTKLWTYEIVDHEEIQGIDSAEEVLSSKIWHSRDEAKKAAEAELERQEHWNERHPWSAYGLVGSISWTKGDEYEVYANVFPLILQEVGQ